MKLMMVQYNSDFKWRIFNFRGGQQWPMQL